MWHPQGFGRIIAEYQKHCFVISDAFLNTNNDCNFLQSVQLSKNRRKKNVTKSFTSLLAGIHYFSVHTLVASVAIRLQQRKQKN